MKRVSNDNLYLRSVRLVARLHRPNTSFLRILAAGLVGLAISLPMTSATLAQSATNVSPDLVDFYAITTEAKTIEDFTAIVDRCMEVQGDRKRSSYDKTYAAQLLAWAANKRGELYGDQASAAADQNDNQLALELDNKAGQDFRLALKYDPKRWRARHNLAVTLAMEQKFEEAIQEFDQVIQQKPDYVNALYNRAELHFHMQQYDLAVADYTKALQLNPADSQMLSGRAHAAFMMEDFEAALADYAEAARLNKHDADLQTDYADALQFVQDWKGAANAYRRALEVNPDHVRGLENVAWMMATCPDEAYRNPASAMKAVKRAIEKSGTESCKAWDTMAAAYAAGKNWKAADEAVGHALELASQEERADLLKRRALYASKKMYVQPPMGESKPSNVARAAVGTGASSR